MRDDLTAALQAILVVSSEPLDPRQAGESLGVDEAEVRQALVDLQASLVENREGWILRETEGTWKLYSDRRFFEIVSGYIHAGYNQALSGPALETLAVIAYSQPTTRAHVATIRGVNVDSVVRTLLTRGLIEEVGVLPSGAVQYGTTALFLEKMGMESLDDLEPLAPYLPEDSELPEIEKELP